MPCLILSTLQPFTSQNDVLYRSLPPENVFAHVKLHTIPQKSSNKVQKAEAFFVARRLTDGKKRAQL
ncbi:hypothetical protein T4E_10888 [Trichinella pseudospiralis]|uniref:Uncharacterized protein n=1 Tax=Trichinella pseudospiralis TaxID=6337 RepID=A0A0V0XFJ9_TRIPS|nr:hypothetical protein T4E_10888 [Trichinella pseudospiralis]